MFFLFLGSGIFRLLMFNKVNLMEMVLVLVLVMKLM